MFETEITINELSFVVNGTNSVKHYWINDTEVSKDEFASAMAVANRAEKMTERYAKSSMVTRSTDGTADVNLKGRWNIPAKGEAKLSDVTKKETKYPVDPYEVMLLSNRIKALEQYILTMFERDRKSLNFEFTVDERFMGAEIIKRYTING